MKKLKILLIFIVITLIFFITNNVFASNEETKLLYQDITINTDGSITVKEAAWLNGEYNGRWRDIEFKNSLATTFTGIYSNFAGNTDIYNGTNIKNVKVYDISQENFKSLEDINKEENTYKEVTSGKNGKYGIYEYSTNSSGAEFKIYCPSKRNKVICMEYTITDAVVVHNDTAELYWNVLGEYFEENIQDFQVLIHLPSEDNDVRIWTHGPLSGENKIIDAKTLYFKDTNVDNYTPETVRIMFNKDIVPLATKKSNVNGREYILKYEAEMADEANRERINEKLELENKASQAVLDLEEYQRIYYYNKALKLVNQLDEENEQKQEYLNRIEATKNAVNEEWKKSLQHEVEWMTDSNYMFLNQRRLEDFMEEIEEGFDEEAKAEYINIYKQLEEALKVKQAKQRAIFTTIVIITYAVLGIIALYKMIKILSERYKYPGRYYREFPNEDEPNVLEYLMKRKSTNLGFSATILNLIAKKVITYEKNTNDNDIVLTLSKENYTGSKAEKIVLSVLFKMVGKDNKCHISKLKKYGKTTDKARKLLEKIKKFKEETKKEVEEKQYFKQGITSMAYKILVNIHYIFSLFMVYGVFYGLELKDTSKQMLEYLILITIISAIYLYIGFKDKNRTLKGKEEYSKWLAHKRFLKNFSNFDEKDLPEITLWEKYLVTATVLGCADKVQKQMKIYIADTSDIDIDTNLLIYQSINLNLTRELNKSLNTAISNSSLTINSSYSSSGGFGGGSSGGGGRTEAGGGGRRSLLKNKGD